MPLKCSIKGKPDISVTVQEVLEKARSEVKDEFFLSVLMSAWHPSSLPLWGFGFWFWSMCSRIRKRSVKGFTSIELQI
ncbi:hypothetical protein GYH30_015350 [Glycine max]|nr:hypothetical protein GYH30_015350 [Glycine max]